MIKEKRKSVRQAMRYTAWIGLGEGSVLRGCMVTDISETGARLELEHPDQLPTTFNLLLSGRGGMYRRCCAVWRSENQIGVRFEKIRAAVSQRESITAEPAGA
jgi:hypothetical protein